MINIDLIIIGVFLVLTLAIGLYYGRGITTFQAYAVGNRTMSTMVISLSLIATFYGGKTLSNGLHNFYHKGFYVLMGYLAIPVWYYLGSQFFILRMKEFIGHLSIAESMGSLYGPAVRIFTAIFGIILNIIVLVAQIEIGLNITTELLPNSSSFQAVMVVLLVIGYSTFGGARAIVLTDVYQFLLFGLYFPILIFILLYYSKDLLTGWQNFTTMPRFNLNNILIQSDTLKQIISGVIMSAVFNFMPAMTQRFYMTSSISQAVKVFKSSILMHILFIISLSSVAIALYVGGHAIQPHQNPLDYIIHLDYFPGMRGILVTAIFALLMSTADSCLHIASVLFTNDIWPFLTGSTKRSQPHALKIVRIASILIGLISLLIIRYTTHTTDLFKGIMLYHLPIWTPFILASFGFRPRAAAVLWQMGISIAIAVYRIYYKKQAIAQYNIFASIAFSMLILLAAHYLLPKHPNTGWVGIKDCSPVDLQNQTSKRWWYERLQQFRLPFTQKYRESLFPKKESTFMLLGSYLIITAIVALCFIKPHYLFPSTYGYMAIMAMGTIIAVYPALYSYQPGGNPLLHRLWLGLLFMVLFIAPIQWTKLGHYGPMVCALLVCSVSVATLLLSLEISMIMLAIALWVHSYMPPYIPFWQLVWSSHTVLSVELVFAAVLSATTMVGLTIYKYLRDKANANLQVLKLTRAFEHKIAVEALYHHANWARLDMTYGNQLLNEMSASVQGQEKNDMHLLMLIDKLHQFNHLLLSRAKAEASLELDPKAIKPVTIESTLSKTYAAIRGLGEPLQLLLRNKTTVTQLLVDPTLFECWLMLNLREISKCTQAVDYIVTLTIVDTALRYNYTPTASFDPSALSLPALAFCFSTETSMQNLLPVYDIRDEIMPIYLPETETQFYQVESKQIVQAHGGYVEIIETAEVLTCLYILLVEGQKVMRSKTKESSICTITVVSLFYIHLLC